MAARQGIAAQISTYPLDARHIEFLLPHHIRVWGSMVNRIIVTIDTHRSRAGRYRADDFDESLRRLRELISDISKSNSSVQFVDVDYSENARRAVARYFFNADSIPIKAWDGGPFYSYFFGLYVANAQYVMHFDGDMLFGGGSKTWMQEAIACMDQRADVMVTAPFPGPPRSDGEIFGHEAPEGFKYTREALPYLAYRHMHVSTRAFMIDMNKFKHRVCALPYLRPSLVQRLKARLLGNPPETREAEVVLSRTLQGSGLYRIDLLGASPGMWSLHPPYRSEEFYRRLPELIQAVEAGDVPDGQRGHYDLNDSMIDWTAARAANNWRRRYTRIIRHRLSSA